MHDPNTVRRIVASAELSDDDVVLEVGPGLGSLTLALLPACRAAGRRGDRPGARRAAARRPSPSGRPELADRLHVVHADAMRVTAAELPVAPTALVANLPYNVAVPVVLHLLAELPSLAKGLVMVQAEVADRMAAGPGSKVYGVPSVKLAWYAECAARAGRSALGLLAGAERRLRAGRVHPAHEPLSTVDRDEVFALGGRRLRAAPQDAAGRARRLGRLGRRGRAQLASKPASTRLPAANS